MTVSISDMTVPPQKPEMIKKAQDTVDLITKNYKRGLITEEERYKEVVETWKKTDDELTKALLNGLDKYNNIFMMADSGARGSDKQIKQLAGMRGLMADTTGHTSSFRSSPISVKVWTYWNTLCPLMERVKVCPIPLCVQQTPDT